MLGISTAISVLAHRNFILQALNQIVGAVEDLNMALGEAIEMVQSRSVEGQNPLVGVLSEVLMQNLGANKPKTKVLQGQDGKFIKNEEEII